MGLLTQILVQHAVGKREEALRKLEYNKDLQDKSLQYLATQSQNPAIAPEDQQGIHQLLLETMGTPTEKFNPSKVSKGFADIMAASHDKAIGAANQQSQQTPANISFPIPGGNYDAGGFESNPPLAPVAPSGMPQLPQSTRIGNNLPTPPTLRAGAPNIAAMPGAPTQMEIPGIPAPGPEVPGVVQPFFSPQRAAEAQVRLAQLMAPAEAAKFKAQYGAQYEAQLAHDMALAGFKHEQTMKMLDDFKKQGFSHFSEAIGANGEPTIKPDPGRMITGIVPGSELEGEIDPKSGKSLDEAKFYRVREFNDGTREYFAQTNVARMERITTPDGQSYMAGFDRNGQEIPGTRTATLNTALLPRTSVQNTPGLPPTTTITAPVLPRANVNAAPGQGPSSVPPNAPPASAGPRPTGGKVQSDSYPAAIRQRAKAVADGSQPMPSDARTGAAVQQYMAEHNLELPSPMTLAGQTALAQVDPVLLEVQELKKFLEDNKIQNNSSRAYFAPKFLNYRAGGDSPYNEFFTSASFESLRSAAAALKGSNSRAYPIIQKALVHTPNLWVDSPKNIYEKLNAVERILSQSRNSIMSDQRKSGVISAPQTSTPPNPPTVKMRAPNGQVGPVPADQVDHYKSLGAVVVTQ